MPYNRTTEDAYAICSGRGGTDTVIHGVRFPAGVDWSVQSPNMGRVPDWPARQVFASTAPCRPGFEVTFDHLEVLADQLEGNIVEYGSSEDEDRKLTRDEIAEKLHPFEGSVVIDKI